MKHRQITLNRVRVHNLKGVDLKLPHHQLIVFTGVSGSGKSSLAFDTIYVEGQRRYIESLSTYARRHLGDLPKPDADAIDGISPTIAIEQKTAGRNPRSTVGTMTGIYDFLRVLYARVAIPHCPVSGEPVQPQSAEHILRKIKSRKAGSKLYLLSPCCRGKKGEFQEEIKDLVRKGFTRIRLDGAWIDLEDEQSDLQIDGRVAHDIDLVIDRIVLEQGEEKRLTDAVLQALECGKGVMSVWDSETQEEQLFSQFAYSPRSGISYPPLEPADFSFNHPSGMCLFCQGLGCFECASMRIKPYPAAAKLNQKRIADLTRLSIDDVASFFADLQLSPFEWSIAEELVKEIRQRLEFLLDVGLGYLSLERTAPTLSGGESQRVRLASQIGSGLVGATYVLDEPSIGLHPRDNLKLLRMLRHLQEKGNTVIVVEHDEETIRAADHIVDVGPLAGIQGGEVLVSGSYADLIANSRSLTGAYLSGRLSIAIHKRRPETHEKLKLIKASHHNLCGVDVEIPLKRFIVVTGVSGSGKSSLISDTLYPALANALNRAELPVGKHQKIENLDSLDKVIAIDQTPIGRTPRSNPATYIKLFDEIRDLFSQLPESVAKGYTAGRFSFNVKEGSCSTCAGMGMLRIDMDFMEDAWIPCETCRGKRFDEATLRVLYRGKSICDVLEMTVEEAHLFFSSIPSIQNKLDTLLKVGLNYLRLGQASPTLSGGEAQRVKLARELARPATGNTLYILDEPTTGLHMHDIAQLIDVLQALVERGNTVLVIEHNMDFVKVADWVIDLGPEGGRHGGKIIGTGTPEMIAEQKSPTGIALRAVLHPCHTTPVSSPSFVSQLSHIRVKNGQQNNLKGVTASIPHGKITVCTGPSGSGKSSFAFETVYAEGQRRYIESLSPYARQFVHQMPKPKVDDIEGLSPAIAIEQKSHAGNPRSTIGTQTEIYDFLRVLYAHLGVAYCPETGEKIEKISQEFVLEKLLSLPEKTKLQILAPVAMKKNESFEEWVERWQKLGFLRIRMNETYYTFDEPIPFVKGRKIDLSLVVDRLIVQDSSRSRLIEAIEQATKLSEGVLIAATDEEDLFFNLSFAVLKTGKSYPPITPHTFSFNTQEGMCLTCQGLGCKVCEGTRLNPLARHVRIGSHSIADLCHLPIDDAILFVEKIQPPPLLIETVNQLRERLHFLQKIGLGYLSLDRTAPTLSGGEAQRIRLARQLGSGLTGTLYVLDEPTIGLHPKDNLRLNLALQHLCQLGNTLLLVEHDPLTVQIADHLIEFGPEAGRHGGQIIASGSLESLKANPDSLTGAYLSGKRTIPIPAKRRTPKGHLHIEKATLHNLRSLNLSIPTGVFVCVTGVSGSGKSTLINNLLRPAMELALRQYPIPDSIVHKKARLSGIAAFDQIIALNQNPIGHTNRADISTYVDLLTPLRYFFAELPEAKARGLKPKHFSFNHRSGMCTACFGLGSRSIPLQFLPSVKVSCDACSGFRLNPLSLQVSTKGKHLGNILKMTVVEARAFLPPIPKVIRILDTLLRVGLGYLELGQEIATLSGGEAQRLRLSRELAKRSKKTTLYLLDEPTVGLHSEDILKLLAIFHALVDQGHSLILIEHHVDVIQNADFIIDLGPGSGVQGGRVIATGTPEELRLNPHSITGPFLKG